MALIYELANPIGINDGKPGQIVVFSYKKSKFTV